MTIEEGYELRIGDVIEHAYYGKGVILKPPGTTEPGLAHIDLLFNSPVCFVVSLIDQPPGIGWSWGSEKNCWGLEYAYNYKDITLISRASKHPLIKTEFLEGVEL